MLALWSIVWCCTLTLEPGKWPYSGHLWYLVGVAALCPLVAVLGARRPVDRVWPAFVLLPLFLVLGLPAISSFWRGTPAPLQLETPTVVGFAIVLVMGAGNYLFTRLSLPVSLLAAGIALLVYPLTEFGTATNRSPVDSAGYAGVCLGLAAASAFVLMRRRNDGLPPHERLWVDFRNAFGIVWAKRVMDRINWTAREEGWPARLDFAGLVWTQDAPGEDEKRRTIDRLTDTFRWLLKRFVDEAWIDRRLGTGNGETLP